MQYWTNVAMAEIAAMVTPVALEAALVLTNATLPIAADLAELRWPSASLLNLLRFRVAELEGGPSDIPAVIEAISLLERPQGDNDDDSLASVLATEFPGAAASIFRDAFAPADG